MRVTFPISEAQYMRVASRAAELEKLDPLDAGADRQVSTWSSPTGRSTRTRGGSCPWAGRWRRAPAPSRCRRLPQSRAASSGPGSTARVRVPRPTDGKPTVVVPESAVKELQGSYTVAVVTPEDTVQIRPVEVGPRVSELWAVTKGVNAGRPGHHRGGTEGGRGAEGRRPARPRRFREPAGCAGGGRGELSRDLRILHPPSHRRHRHLDPTGARRRGAALRLPIAQFPEIVPPQIQPDDHATPAPTR